jgi:aminoglycoside phosphotransferase (APT) family kinase protein
MWQLDRSNLSEYLQSRAMLEAGETAIVAELTGGVSNVVLLVERPARGERFVVKQARGQLRVKEEWLCPVERIWREVATLRTCGELLTASGETRGVVSEGELRATVPKLLWEDRDNYAYAMTAAPAEHRTWKAALLAGQIESGPTLAAACGQLLATLHAGSWNDPALAGQFDERTYFDQLRLDPYYRHMARSHADLQPAIERLIDSVWHHRRALVHGDFSPKNLLVWPGHVMLIDFEVGHYGDPAFDLGFFLSHLVLKSVWAGTRGGDYRDLARRFWLSYR